MAYRCRSDWSPTQLLGPSHVHHPPDGRRRFFGDDDGGRLVMLDNRPATTFAHAIDRTALFIRPEYKFIAGTVAEGNALATRFERCANVPRDQATSAGQRIG